MNKEDLIYKIEELVTVLNLIDKGKVNKELMELCYKYSNELILYKNIIIEMDFNNITYNNYRLIRQAENNINKLYQFRNYIEKLNISKDNI